MKFSGLFLALGLGTIAPWSVAQEGPADPLQEQVDEAIRESEERIGRMAPGVGDGGADPVSEILKGARARDNEGEDHEAGDGAADEAEAPPIFPPVPEVTDPLEPFALDEEAMARFGIVRDEKATDRFGSPVFKPYSYGERPVPRDRLERRLDQLFSGSDPAFNTLQDPAARTRQQQQDRTAKRYQGYVEPNTGFITPPGWPSSTAP